MPDPLQAVSDGRPAPRERARPGTFDPSYDLEHLSARAAELHHEVRNPISGIRQALRAVGKQLGADELAILEDFEARLEALAEGLRALRGASRPNAWAVEVREPWRRTRPDETSEVGDE